MFPWIGELLSAIHRRIRKYRESSQQVATQEHTTKMDGNQVEGIRHPEEQLGISTGISTTRSEQEILRTHGCIIDSSNRPNIIT